MKYLPWPFSSERKKNTQHALSFLSVDKCFRECFDQWQSVIRFPAVARCCEVSASVPDISGFQNYLLLEEFLHLLIFPRAFFFSSCIFPLFWQTCMGKDVTLHVSASNPAMLLYQKFGFKTEEYVLDFYDKYYPLESTECKHAFFLRLRRWCDLNRAFYRKTFMLLQTGLYIDLTHFTVSLISAIRHSLNSQLRWEKRWAVEWKVTSPSEKSLCPFLFGEAFNPHLGTPQLINIEMLLSSFHRTVCKIKSI